MTVVEPGYGTWGLTGKLFTLSPKAVAHVRIACAVNKGENSTPFSWLQLATGALSLAGMQLMQPGSSSIRREINKPRSPGPAQVDRFRCGGYFAISVMAFQFFNWKCNVAEVRI